MKAEQRLIAEASPSFDEFLVLRFVATNEDPYPFSWVNFAQLEMEYSAILTRVSREYDKRF